MNRSGGFSLGGSFAPHRQLQQQQTGGLGSGSVSASDLQHLQASIADSFSSSHGLSGSYHSQASRYVVILHWSGEDCPGWRRYMRSGANRWLAACLGEGHGLWRASKWCLVR
jgi:hypothetical protein